MTIAKLSALNAKAINVQMLSFMQKWAYLNLEQKLFYFGIFQLEFEKSHCGIWNRHPQIS